MQRRHRLLQVNDAARRQRELVPPLAPRDGRLRAGTGDRPQAAPQAADEDAQGVVPGIGHGVAPDRGRHVAAPGGLAPMEHEERPEPPSLPSREGVLADDGTPALNGQATAELDPEGSVAGFHHCKPNARSTQEAAARVAIRVLAGAGIGQDRTGKESAVSDHRTTASTSRTARKAKRFPHDYANWHVHLAAPGPPPPSAR